MGVEIYFIIFGIVFLINVFVPRVKATWVRRSLLTLSFALLVCFVGFRYNVGTDYDNYLDIYKSIKGESLQFALSQNVDPLNGLSFWALSRVAPVDFLIFFFYGIMSILPIYLVNRRFGYKYLCWSLLIYCLVFLPFSLNGMMQGAAMSLLLLASLYLSENKTKESIIALILAVLFHKSALLVVPCFVLYFILRNNKRRFLRLNVLCTILISVFILFFLNDFLASNDVGSYKSYSYILNKISVDRVSFSTTILYLPLILFSYITRRNDKNNQMVLQRNMLYSGIVYNLVGSSAQYLNRIALYFTVMALLVIPFQIMKMTETKTRMALKILLLAYMVAVFVVQIAMLGWYDIVPYQTWLFNEV